MQSADKLTSEEAEQYDRQIRLWGLEAQKRLDEQCVKSSDCFIAKLVYLWYLVAITVLTTFMNEV